MHLVIYGAGPLARLMLHYFEHDTSYRVAAFCVDRAYLREDTFCGRPVVAYEEVRERHPPGDHHMFVAIGYKRMRDRKLLYDKAKEAGYRCASYASPRAVLHTGEVGENNVFMDQVLIEPFTSVGDNNLFWSGTIVCHECVIGSHNYLAPRVVIGGMTTLEDGCFLGLGATAINGLVLHEETMLLPGACACKDCAAFTRYAGIPAAAVGTHREAGIVIPRG